VALLALGALWTAMMSPAASTSKPVAPRMVRVLCVYVLLASVSLRMDGRLVETLLKSET
jgi:hypothetical protein